MNNTEMNRTTNDYLDLIQSSDLIMLDPITEEFVMSIIEDREPREIKPPEHKKNYWLTLLST